MNEIGKLDDTIEFVDLHKETLESKKNYSAMIARCDNMEKKFTKFEKVCEDHGIDLIKYENFKKFIKELNEDEKVKSKNGRLSYFDLIENEILEDEKRFDELMDSYNKIKEFLEYLTEKKAVYKKFTELFCDENFMKKNATSIDENFLLLETGRKLGQSDLNYIAGVAKADDELRMKRMIFRVSHGRAISHFFNFEDEDNIINVSPRKSSQPKKIFTIFLQSGTENLLLNKMIKICDLFGVSTFSVPKQDEMQYEFNKVRNEIEENKKFMKEAENSINVFMQYRTCEANGEPGKYDLHRLYFKKERQIFSNLNKCNITEILVIGEIWVPKDKFSNLKKTLDKISETDSNNFAVSFEDLETVNKTPPTYFKSNDFVFPFQEIVNTYGIPRYREANPALFAIVTFPFLFGVMFGDIGHGFMLFLFAAYLCLRKEEIVASKSSLIPALKTRYILLFMGFFAFYAGWMYNDFISIPLNVFGSCYHDQGTVAVRENQNCVYPFGVDPKWYVASNELAFFNSIKMKLSVIIGVIQMTFGIVLKGMNTIYFNNYIDFIFEFIPQLIFMVSFFGYMIVMIFIKWSINWKDDTSQAPSIITLLMNIFLKGGSVDGRPLWGCSNADGYTQENVQFWLLIICLICVPVILIPKPFILNRKHKNAGGAIDQAHHEESLADLFVHQAIETIEFVLGSISNTASYLRLWALSLAHAQLAKVFFERALLGFIQQGSLVMVILGFFIFANITLAVLMFMDLMECFLHTLRLHWVEFQNKFYKADGIKFNPFSFRYLIG